MFQQQKDWETRENAFAAFTMGPLTDFWRQRDEAEFTGAVSYTHLTLPTN